MAGTFTIVDHVTKIRELQQVPQKEERRRATVAQYQHRFFANADSLVKLPSLNPVKLGGNRLLDLTPEASILLFLGCLAELVKARASIWRTRSFVTPISSPTSFSVSGSWL